MTNNMTFLPPSQSITVSLSEVSRLVGLSAPTVLSLSQKGEFAKAFKIGGKWFFSRQDVEKFLLNKKEGRDVR